MYGGATAPSGWLLCNGDAVSRTTYADLFAVLGTTFGVGNGSTTFNVPDMRSRMPIGVGAGTGLSARTLAQTGGVETQTISSANLPTHQHTLSAHTHTSAAHSHNANHAHTASSGFVTSDHAHNIPRGLIATAGTNRAVVSTANNQATLFTGGISANHQHGITVDGNNFDTSSTTPGATGGPSSDTTGNGGFANTALNIMNPFLALNFIIRT
jgi:microcystin-dependent protein